MPRAYMPKASTASRRASPHERYFDLQKQPTVIERVASRVFEIVMNSGQEAAIIDVYNDIVIPLLERAPIFKDRNGRRIEQSIHQALARLAANGYIEYCPHRDDVERFCITRHFQTIIQELIDRLIATCPDTFHYNAIAHHRFNCCFFRTKFRRNFKRILTRRELDLENRILISKSKEHARICPIVHRSRSVATEATELWDQSTVAPNPAGPSRTANDRENGDSMYVEDVPRTESQPVASGSGLHPPQTPIRSRTLNGIGAYPSPESLERTTSVAPLTPEPTPSRSRSIPSVVGSEDNGLDNMQTDLDALGDDPPRILGTLFTQDESQSPPQDSYLRIQTKHDEEMTAVRTECDEQLRAKDFECDARLAAQRVEFEEELTVKIAEKERWWSRKLNSFRRACRLRILSKDRQTTRRMNHQIARSRRQKERIKTLEDRNNQTLITHNQLKEQYSDLLATLKEYYNVIYGSTRHVAAKFPSWSH